ncbi:MAG: glycosyl hydrolase family 8, partial [Ilumatobacteraceae bacterium]
MSRRLPQLVVALVALFGIVAVVLAVRPGDDDRRADVVPTTVEAPSGAPAPTVDVPQASPAEEADAAAVDFLERYVEADGRVHRVPEDDTVSEGQAYAMLLAVATDDQPTFDRVWTWTKANLLRRDGTLAWQWVDGAVVDPNAATDADLDAGRALLLAADRFDRPAYRTDGLAIGEAILEHGVIDTDAGPVLVAGPWAT